MELRCGSCERELKAVAEKEALHDLLAKLIKKFENSGNSAYDFGKLPDSYKYGLIEGIVGFAMEIERLEGKFKLGQERSEADREGILRNLRSARPARSMVELTASYYEWAKVVGKSAR